MNILENLKFSVKLTNIIMIRDLYVEFEGSRMHYAKTGLGEKHLLIFHGFGQDMSVFQLLAQTLAKHYTLYIFDLYFHGRSKWAHNETPLTKDAWKKTVEVFLEKNGVKRFSVAGFSMGGKFALATMESFSEKVDEVILVAPDGIKTSFWYSMATYPPLLRKFFKSMIVHPDRFERMARWLSKLSFIDKGLVRFAEYQMNTEEKRKRVYYSWVVFRKLNFDLNGLARTINHNKISLKLITGKYDKVIPSSDMKTFLRKLDHPKFIELDSGHSGLIDLSIPHFISHNVNPLL